MTPSCVVWSVMMLNMSWPPTILYSISALRPTSGSSALIRPMAPPISVDSTAVTRKESISDSEFKKKKIHSCLKVFYKSMQQREKRPPTVGEARRAVVHVGEADADCGGSWKAAHLSGHVFSLDHNLIILLDFSVHARQGCLDQAWGKISRFMVSLF